MNPVTNASHHLLLHFPMPDPAWQVPSALVEQLRAQYPSVSLYWYDGATAIDPALAVRIDIYFTHVPDLALLRQLPNLRWCHTSAVQWAPHVDPAMLQSPCEFTTGRGTFAPWVAAQVLECLERWNLLPTSGVGHVEDARPIAIIGLGGNGRAIAEQLHARGMRVWASVRSPYGRSDLHVEWLTDTPTLLTHLHEVAGVILAAPLTRETLGLVNAHCFARMPSPMWLINTGRAPIIEAGFLETALQQHRLSHVAVDTALPPDHPWFADPRITKLPHMHPGLPGVWDAAFTRFAEQLHRYLNNESLHDTLNRELGY